MKWLGLVIAIFGIWYLLVRYRSVILYTFVRLNPPFFKNHYFKKAVRNIDFEAVRLVGLYGSGAQAELLQLLEIFKPENKGEFDIDIYNRHFRGLKHDDPQRVEYFERFTKYCLYIEILNQLALQRYSGVLPQIKEIASSHLKRNEEASEMLANYPL